MNRRRKSHKGQTVFLGLMTAVLAIVFIIAAKDHGADDDTFQEELPGKELNKTITNEMSAVPDLEGLDKKINRYLRDWHIKGASIAITRNDSLVYAKGYGWADEELEIPMEPGHIMRVASVSKLLTAAGIMVLQDQGKLSIKDPVFGPEGILNDEFFNELTQCDERYCDITIEDIMRHRSRFYSDPVFRAIQVQEYMELDQLPTKEDYFTLVLRNKLRGAPGTATKYSNFGYIVLSEVIEKASGMPYEDFMKKHVLKPAGCYDMHIGGIYYEDKRDNEVRYYTHEGDGKYIEEYTDSGIMVERCYGGNNIPLLSGAGAWCGSPAEIARFVASIDGRPEVPDIITPESVKLMTGYYDKDTFSLGWNDTHPAKGWSRSGTLSGTTALVKLFPDGECWVFISNTSTWKGPRQAKYTDALFRQCRELFSDKLPCRNLFE